MMHTSLSPQDVAAFLSQHPKFFDTHADLFASLQVPHIKGHHTISLGERQVLVLRERIRELEWRLTELIRHAESNESTQNQMMLWNKRMLAEKDVRRLPGEIALGLAEQFESIEVALRIWGLAEFPETGYGLPVSEEIRLFTDSLKNIYCGSDIAFEAVTWLHTLPKSLALIALRFTPDSPSVGLLVLGSPDPERYTSKSGTAFLETIGQWASAALQRLS